MRSLVFAVVTTLGMLLQLSSAIAGVISSRATEAGVPVNGVALSLKAASPTVRLGTPVIVLVEVRNVSNHEIRVDYPNVGANYDFVALDHETGIAVLKKSIHFVSGNSIYSIFGGGMRLEPGESWLEPVTISTYFDFSKPGEYDIRATASRVVCIDTRLPLNVTSNAAVVDVTP